MHRRTTGAWHTACRRRAPQPPAADAHLASHRCGPTIAARWTIELTLDESDCDAWLWMRTEDSAVNLQCEFVQSERLPDISFAVSPRRGASGTRWFLRRSICSLLHTGGVGFAALAARGESLN
jgi:hypothetical protein